MITAILIGLAIAGLTYLTYKLTIAALRMYRKRKNTQIILADFRDMIRQMPDKEKRKYSFEELNQISDKKFIAEFDEENDEFVQAQFISSQGMDSNIENLLSNNDGFVIIED